MLRQVARDFPDLLVVDAYDCVVQKTLVATILVVVPEVFSKDIARHLFLESKRLRDNGVNRF